MTIFSAKDLLILFKRSENASMGLKTDVLLSFNGFLDKIQAKNVLKNWMHSCIWMVSKHRRLLFRLSKKGSVVF